MAAELAAKQIFLNNYMEPAYPEDSTTTNGKWAKKFIKQWGGSVLSIWSQVWSEFELPRQFLHPGGNRGQLQAMLTAQAEHKNIPSSLIPSMGNKPRIEVEKISS
jgi:hypothetical protein